MWNPAASKKSTLDTSPGQNVFEFPHARGSLIIPWGSSFRVAFSELKDSVGCERTCRSQSFSEQNETKGQIGERSEELGATGATHRDSLHHFVCTCLVSHPS